MSATMFVPAAVVARMRVAWRTRVKTCWHSRSTKLKSARMPWHMISGVMLTMWAWRMWRRLTMSVICMREWSSLGWTWTAKRETWEVSMSARTGAGMSARGRGARSSRRKAFHGQPTASSWAASAGGDGSGDSVGDESDFFLWLDAETGGDGGAGSLGEFGGVRGGKQLRGGLVHVQITSSVQGEGTGF